MSNKPSAGSPIIYEKPEIKVIGLTSEGILCSSNPSTTIDPWIEDDEQL